MFKKYFVFISVLFSIYIQAQSPIVQPLLAPNEVEQQQWVQTQYDSLTLEQKIGQLLALDINTSKTSESLSLQETIKAVMPGTVFFNKSSIAGKQVNINAFNQILPIPLLVASETMANFPASGTLAALKDETLMQRAASHWGKHLELKNIHLSFIPKFPASYGSSVELISEIYTLKDIENTRLFIKNLHSKNKLSCGEFTKVAYKAPISTEVDLDAELLSFVSPEFMILNYYAELVNGGVSAISTSYKNQFLSALSNDNHRKFSQSWLANTIKNKLDFQGLLISGSIKTEDNALALLLSGHHILRCSPKNISTVFTTLKTAFETATISEEYLEKGVKKVLMAKFKAGIQNEKPQIEAAQIDTFLLENKLLNEDIAENAITLIKNNKDLVPVRDLGQKKIAYLSLGEGTNNHFINSLKWYTKVDEIETTMLDEILDKLKSYNLVVIGLHPSNSALNKSNQFSAKHKTWLYEISRQHNVVLTVFTNPAELSNLATLTNTESIVVSYENGRTFQEKAAQVIFGAISTKGILPIKVTDEFARGTSFQTNSLSRLSYGLPEKVGLQSSKLKKIDSVVNQAIKNEIMPGAQLLIARKGKVVYHKSFGKTKYKNGDSINNHHLYDLASLTKILATLPMVMKLEEEKKIGLRQTLQQFYPPAKDTNKKDITLLEMLTHYGRLSPWIPFYLYTLDSLKKPSKEFYRTKPMPDFSTKVVGNLYIRNDYKDSIRERILKTKLRKRKEYRYSDLPYYILKEVIEKKLGDPLDMLTQKTLYKSIGANYTTYKPLEKFPRNRIVPSEDDTYYRHQVIQGYVHDMGAAMQGGVGGHAGLFSNANDIAKIMQMYLWEGYYGGKRYFKTGTIDRFNKCYFCKNDNRRGVGFDKPQLVEKGPTCGCVSMKSFGHSGFTGTYTWADPEKEIVYVFLSNRTFPTSQNRKLIKEGTRTQIQQLIYDAISE